MTMPCTTPMAMAILTKLKMTKFQFIFDLHRHAGVAESLPRQTIERGHFLRHLVEKAFDGHKAVLAGDIVDEVMQKFPFGARVTGGFHGLHEFLDAALAVGERAALLRVRTAGQN